jgi:NADH:ubiquinone oxidoreductase subunit 4 (subunit M)
MIENLAPVFVLGVIGYFVLELVKAVSESRLRHKLIEKGMVDEKVKLLFQPQILSHSASSLKWGLVLIAVGLAFLFTYGIHSWLPSELREEMTAGAVFFMAGLAMIVYYAIARGQEKKN